MRPTFFVSYRRDDASAEAGRIADAVRGAFGGGQTFLDTSRIEAGDRWPDELQEALGRADVLIAVIGPDWLRLGDEYGVRRIDQADDWVRREVGASLTSGKRVVPVLVRGARRLRADKLPDGLRGLAAVEPLEIRRDYWDHDVKLLLSVLGSVAAAQRLPHTEVTDIYPKAPPEVPDPLGAEKIAVALNGTLHRWAWTTSRPPELMGAVREELARSYRFATFRDAVDFMAEVAPGCDVALHHPRWENIFRTVFVHLSTWDIGHRVSDRDVQLAKYFDRAYDDFIARLADPR